MKRRQYSTEYNWWECAVKPIIIPLYRNNDQIIIIITIIMITIIFLIIKTILTLMLIDADGGGADHIDHQSGEQIVTRLEMQQSWRRAAGKEVSVLTAD